MKDTFNRLVLTLLLIIMLGPIIWLFVLSIKLESAIVGNPIGPFNPTFEHYYNMFVQFKFSDATFVSTLIALFVLMFTLPVASLAAYGLSRFPFKGSKWFFIFLLFCRMVVPAIIILPMYKFFSTLGLKGTIWPIVFGHLSWTLPFAILILQSFCEEMPKDMEEAARLDGLSDWGVFWKIAFPLMAPGIAVIGVVTFSTSWNEFLFAAAFSTAYLKTGPVLISSMITEWAIYWGPLAASGIYWSTPIVVVAILFNRRLIRAFTLRYYG